MYYVWFFLYTWKPWLGFFGLMGMLNWIDDEAQEAAEDWVLYMGLFILVLLVAYGIWYALHTFGVI